MLLFSYWFNSLAQQPVRTDKVLSNNWRSIATSNDALLDTGLYQIAINDRNWKQVAVPHNWDAYEGYRRLLHGNRHGDAWYRKFFAVQPAEKRKRYFLFFEGVGTYATIYVNGKKAGEHAGGRTSFTIDITLLLKTDGSNNLLAVRAYHPSGITDLPWVCGGCSDDRGFSEGSQPMGIFRPVHLIGTGDIRIEPFGVHAWADIQQHKADLFIATTVKNYSQQQRTIRIEQQVKDAAGKIVANLQTEQSLRPGDSITLPASSLSVKEPVLWSVAHPYLYHIVSVVTENKKLIDQTATVFGFRTISWKTGSHQFLLNGKPVFINGIAEYEHALGQSHAFSNEQIASRIKWLKAAGFNAFRDAHQPHNLLYGQLCNKEGLLWWSQFSAHIWYDAPAFRTHFKQLLREWVLERRNDPALVLWGLQNESKLPADFAKECTELIRQLDPTASSQRLVTTCNGGEGTDWDVPQNWTGTYGGNPDTYAQDIKKQVLIGEYGAWRTIDLHTEGGFLANGPVSEDRMVQLMEKKIRLAESVSDSCAGQFFWLLASHDNPGRIQGGEGQRELDRIGPVNYKGMLTSWEEPTDAFYMFRSNYAPAAQSPMVYIVSHTWPNRWTTPGIQDSLLVYSNCDEVELFNDLNAASLGRQKNQGRGTHFLWNQVLIQYNILYAVGYVNGKVAARDTLVLQQLPAAPHYQQLYANATDITKPATGYHYVYRVNCGGPDYTDIHGNTWLADRALPVPEVTSQPVGSNRTQLSQVSRRTQAVFGSRSWTNEFTGLPAFFASQRRTFSAIKGSRDWPLLQDFRYGRDKLDYEFPVPDGDYLVELYFIEPWLGIGGGMDAAGMRLFDVAINNETVIKDLDIWKEAGINTALKKSVGVSVRSGRLVLSFPRVKAGQAIISAIAISSLQDGIRPAASPSLIGHCIGAWPRHWLDVGNRLFADTNIFFHSLPPNIFGADWLQFSTAHAGKDISFTITEMADVYIGADSSGKSAPWMTGYENTQTVIETGENGTKKYVLYRKRFDRNDTIRLPFAGANQPVIIMPVTALQPAYDLKAITSYRSNVAVITGAATKEPINGKESVVVHSSDKTGIRWPVQTGVADRYSITLKYYSPAAADISATVQLKGPDGNLLQEEQVRFTFTRPGKWNTVGFNTQGMINAGHYTIELLVEKGAGLALNGIDIQ